MQCPDCGRTLDSDQCRCGWQMTKLTAVAAYVIQHCSQPGCSTAIQVRVGQTIEKPICKWCKAGTAYRYPPLPGPDPDNPWPWQTEAERERRLRLPFWRDRFQQLSVKHPEYAKWVREPVKIEEPTEHYETKGAA